jgi:hypothetical protein
MLVTTLFSSFGGDPEDKFIGITLSLRAVSPVTVVAITVVDGPAELEIKYKEMVETEQRILFIFRAYDLSYVITYQNIQPLITLSMDTAIRDRNDFNILIEIKLNKWKLSSLE